MKVDICGRFGYHVCAPQRRNYAYSLTIRNAPAGYRRAFGVYGRDHP
jgi:hypothetical protein